MIPLYSVHAQRRMHEMDVGFDEVAAVLSEPATSYPSPPSYGPGRRVVVGGRLAVVVEDSTGVVITVLWRGRTGRCGGEVA